MDTEQQVNQPLAETQRTVKDFIKLFFEVSQEFPASVTVLAVFTAQFFKEHQTVPMEEVKAALLLDNKPGLQKLAHAISLKHYEAQVQHQEKGEPLSRARKVSAEVVADILRQVFDLAEQLDSVSLGQLKTMVTKIRTEMFERYKSQAALSGSVAGIHEVEMKFLDEVFGELLNEKPKATFYDPDKYD